MPDWERPVWFDGTSINEALFCEEFLREHRILFARLGEQWLSILSDCRLGSPLLTHTDLVNPLLNGSHQGRVFAALCPADFLLYHRDVDHMEMIVVNILSQLL